MMLEWGLRSPVLSCPEVTTWTSLTAAEAATLRQLATDKQVLEIGTAFGYSMAVMAAVASSVWTIDFHTVQPGWGFYNFPAAPLPGFESTLPVVQYLISSLGLKNVGLAKGDARELLALGSDFADLLTGIEFAFIDGDHGYKSCMTDLVNCERIVGPGGVIAVHDYGDDSNPEVPRAVEDWRRDRPVDVIDTLAVIKL